MSVSCLKSAVWHVDEGRPAVAGVRGPAVSVTEFKVLADKIGAEDPEMKLIPQSAGPA